MIQQQEKNVISTDTEAIDALKQKLTTMIPGQAKCEQAEKRILPATSRANFRSFKNRRANEQQNKADDINDLKAKISELLLLLFPTVKMKKGKSCIALKCVFHWLFPLQTRAILSAEPSEISTKIN